jgi:polyhydroxyalkanoate synthase subunit PhaC
MTTPPSALALAAGHAKTAEASDDALATIDRAVHAALARVTGGLSPTALAGSVLDWAAHLASSPGKQFELVGTAIDGAMQDLAFAWQSCLGVEQDPSALSLRQDARFRDRAWRSPPFSIYARTFLSIERWWETATTGLHGVDARNQAMVAFGARQILDTVAPSNFIWTNPRVLEQTRAEAGINLLRGWGYALEDAVRARTGGKPVGTEAFAVGKTVAVTPGKVIHRNRLAEIIQYAAATPQVHPEPIVIVPAWIMKYYILDLSPVNSLVKYLTEQGFTVFVISWKNPDSDDRDLGLDDYRTYGIKAAIDAATTITGSRSVHAVGYCLGGTLLAIAAASMGRDRDNRLASLTFFAAQIDFTEAGELMLFINESQVDFLEDMMWERGYLEAGQMAGAFEMLRSNDLIWSRLVHEYLMGERTKPMDIMAWNADATRMPYRMHSEYLRSLFLNNDLAEGRFKVEGRPIALHDIHVPIFAVATEQDHVAPWRSVFKFHVLTDADVTFVLTNGGHNAGVLSEPGHPHRHFRISSRGRNEPYLGPDAWLKTTPAREGSWWPAFTQWLTERSGPLGTVPPLGQPRTKFAPIADAPGSYILQR